MPTLYSTDESTKITFKIKNILFLKKTVSTNTCIICNAMQLNEFINSFTRYYW